MKNFSNNYIFFFSAAMVIVVASILSFVSSQLNPRQEMNEKIEKMKNILSALHIESTTANAEELYNQYITNSYVVNYKGEKMKNLEAFDVDMKKELNKIKKINNLEESITQKQESPFKTTLRRYIDFKVKDVSIVKNKILDIRKERHLPVYESEKDGKKYYVFPLRGKGLWGPIWGYIALGSDFTTVYGAYFDHKTETPGLGAEIETNWYQEQFDGKQIYNQQNEFTSIDVVKGGAPEGDPHSVDAVSGGTITSNGLDKMLHDCLKAYQNFFNKEK